MTVKASTGLRNALLTSSNLRTLLAAGFIKIYGGTAPTDADQPVNGPLLCTISISSGGTGINLDPLGATNGVLLKSSSETWSGVNAVTGTAVYYRHVGASDTGVLSTSQPRLQGDIYTAGSDMNLSTISLGAGATQTIDYYSIALPAF